MNNIQLKPVFTLLWSNISNVILLSTDRAAEVGRRVYGGGGGGGGVTFIISAKGGYSSGAFVCKPLNVWSVSVHDYTKTIKHITVNFLCVGWV